MANTVTFNRYDYMQKLRIRIAKLTCWQDVLNVKYSNARAIGNSYMSTEPDLVDGTRGTAYTHQDFALTADTLTINQMKTLDLFIDEADRFQQTYVNQMSLADYQGKKISEKIESLMLEQHDSWTDFGAADLDNTGADDATPITVSSTNIDNLIRAIKRKIHTNNGIDFAVERGYFTVLRPSDFELLEAFVMANGFREADIALKNGIPVQKAFRYMGVDHYLSTQLPASHLYAGIKKSAELGILRGTFGKVKFIENPGLKSGLGIEGRFDYGFNFPAQLAQFSMDINVS